MELDVTPQRAGPTKIWNVRNTSDNSLTAWGDTSAPRAQTPTLSATYPNPTSKTNHKRHHSPGESINRSPSPSSLSVRPVSAPWKKAIDGSFGSAPPLPKRASSAPPNKAQLCKMFSRLSSTPPPNIPDLPPRIPIVVTKQTKTEEHFMVQRLYYEAQRRKKLLAKKMDVKWYGEPLKPNKLDADELGDSVERLYWQQKKRDEYRKQELMKKYLEPCVKPHKRLSPEDINRIARRLADTKANDKELAEKLDAKYNPPRPEAPKMSPADILQSANRLTQKVGAE
eukprot:TRINITY_DN67977_c11_g5_i1.p1 TRINITY_DN67977_c11_g5~~TRINITY_DN67977_c11_g5_i1.p1  ORF type:complete len:283 (-),score=29.42 TRINITY_DN67977_c11_g5_i1:961-1809(-)